MVDQSTIIVVDPEIQGGVPCFAGTRVPVQSLLDAIGRGRPIDYFLEQFPTIRRTQVEAVIDRRLQLPAPPPEP